MRTTRAAVTMTLGALLVAALVGAGARPAAACSKRHQSLFELFDLAADVAVVKVGKVPRAHYAGPVALRVERRFKGRGKATISARENNTSCATGFRGGRRALVFLERDRSTTGAYEGYVEAPTDRTLAAMAAWAAAATPAERVAVLIATATAAPRPAGPGADEAAQTLEASDRELALDAAYFLADHPDLIALVDAAQSAALVAARGDRRTDEWIALVLARQHGAAWRDMKAAGALPPTPRRGAQGPIAALAAHDYEAITDAGALADLIASTPGEHAPERIAAFERCERVHGRALTEISSYGRGHAEQWWLKLAEACRTGTPPRW